MNYTYHTNPHTQSIHYYNTMKSLYQDLHNRTSLPVLSTPHHIAIYLPDIKINYDPNIQSKIKSSNINRSNLKPTHPLINQISKQLPANLMQLPPEPKSFKNYFQKFIPKLNNLTTLNLNNIHYHITPTHIGTNASFHLHQQNTYITYRLDQGIHHAFHMIIASIIEQTHAHDENNQQDWHTRQSIADYIYSQIIKPHFPNTTFSGTLPLLKQNHSQIIQQSIQYLYKLKLPFPNSFTYSNNFTYYNKKIIHGLSLAEQKILTILIQNKNQLITFDQLAQAYWQNQVDQKFSLEALTKRISQIKRTLKLNNIPNQKIYTLRKQGYILYD